MRHGDAFGRAGRSGGEDDPGVVARQRRTGPPAPRGARAARHAGFADDRDDVGLAEHQFGAFVGVVGIDGDVGRADGQGRQDRFVERKAARRHPDADPVAATDPAGRQPGDAGFDVADHLAVGELNRAVVDRGGFRVARGGVVEDVDQRARVRGARRRQVLRRDWFGSLGRRHPTKILKGGPFDGRRAHGG